MSGALENYQGRIRRLNFGNGKAEQKGSKRKMSGT